MTMMAAEEEEMPAEPASQDLEMRINMAFVFLIRKRTPVSRVR
jgi:hypothetical protein